MKGPMPRRVCKRCKVEKCIRDFYRHPSCKEGRMPICKRCKIIEGAENKELKAEYYRDKNRKRDLLPHRIAQRRAYDKSPRGKAAHLAANNRYRRFKRLERAA